MLDKEETPGFIILESPLPSPVNTPPLINPAFTVIEDRLLKRDNPAASSVNQ
jgi:hypothetical protein